MLHNFVLDKNDRKDTTFLYLLNLTLVKYMYFGLATNYMYNILHKFQNLSNF